MNLNINFIGIVIENKENIPEVNHALSEFGDFIIGRMGIPHQGNKYNVISIVMVAPKEIVSKFEKKIEKLDGITTCMMPSN